MIVQVAVRCANILWKQRSQWRSVSSSGRWLNRHLRRKLSSPRFCVASQLSNRILSSWSTNPGSLPTSHPHVQALSDRVDGRPAEALHLCSQQTWPTNACTAMTAGEAHDGESETEKTQMLCHSSPSLCGVDGPREVVSNRYLCRTRTTWSPLRRGH